MTEQRAWAMYDRRTGQRVGMATVGPSRWQADKALRFVRNRDAAGGRPDLHDVVPHLDVIELTDGTWGSKPGDVIGPAVDQ